MASRPLGRRGNPVLLWYKQGIPQSPVTPKTPAQAGFTSMTKQIFTFEIDLTNPPPLTEAQEAELAALEGRPVDTSDIPPLDESFWNNAICNPFIKANK